MSRLGGLSKGILFVVLSAMMLVGETWAANKNPEIEAEIQEAIRHFSSNSTSAYRNAIEKLKWAGISDRRVYDDVERRLLADFMSTDKHAVEAIAWRAKALSVSGNRKYQPTLQKVMNDAASKKVRKYGNQANTRLDNYIIWNPIIAAGTEKAAKGKLNQKRIANMLSSKVLELNRGGAKLTYRDYSANDKLLKLVEKKLLEIYKVDPRNKLEIDTTAHLAKALAGSGKEQYKSTLEKVMNETTSPKVTKYIKKYMQTYY